MGYRADGSRDSDPVLLSVRPIPGGDRRLVYTVCREYLVIDLVAGEITVYPPFEEKKFLAAAAAFRAPAGGENAESVEDSGERGDAFSGGLCGLSWSAVVPGGL